MEISRSRTAAPAVRIHESRPYREGKATPLRSPSNPSATFQPATRPMTVPRNARVDEGAPPPLPPPPYIEDLARGLDPGWTWGNRHDGRELDEPTLAPIRHGSSLRGGRQYGMEASHSPQERSDDEMDIDAADAREGSASTLHSFSSPGPSPALGHVPASSQAASYGATHQLKSERPLAQRALEDSSHAYDKKLLSRFGKLASPGGTQSAFRNDGAANTGSSPLSTDSQARPASSADFQTSPGDDASLRALNTSLAHSPNARMGWRDFAGYVASNAASTAPLSASEMDSWHGTRHAEHNRYPTSASMSGFLDETGSLSGRSNRSGYDQVFLPDPESEIPSEEATAFRQLQIEDPASARTERRILSHGQKRRRSSRSHGKMQEIAQATQLNTNVDNAYRTFPAGAYPRSPATHSQHHQDCISSVCSSGPKYGSYTSSAGFSVGRSSVTSTSTFDKSPGGLSPRLETDKVMDSPYSSAAGLPQNVSSLPTRALKPAPQGETSAATSLPAKATSDFSSRSKGSLHSTGSFTCSCCPKKPKRFATAGELRQHVTEKQYECPHCGNRFKNKNEAERHRNSLHLRRQSWSCAAMAGPEAAFHPTNTSVAVSTPYSSTDSCGYCGAEFSNSPRPDWGARKEHLMAVHKFGDCNKSKKFFRADHFRQHLKHSHAGLSGKWTNMLENACMKEESPTDEASSPGGDEAVSLTPASGVESLSTQDEENDD